MLIDIGRKPKLNLIFILSKCNSFVVLLSKLIVFIPTELQYLVIKSLNGVRLITFFGISFLRIDKNIVVDGGMTC